MRRTQSINKFTPTRHVNFLQSEEQHHINVIQYYEPCVQSAHGHHGHGGLPGGHGLQVCCDQVHGVGLAMSSLSISLTDFMNIYIYIYLSITLSLPFLHFISLGLSILLFISVYLSRVGIGVACAIFTARQGCRIKSLRIHLKFLKS